MFKRKESNDPWDRVKSKDPWDSQRVKHLCEEKSHEEMKNKSLLFSYIVQSIKYNMCVIIALVVILSPMSLKWRLIECVINSVDFILQLVR